MQFFDDSLHPENMDKVVITVAPYGPEWMPEDFPEDIPVTMDEQIQKAVECYEAGATVLHLHVRELDGKGSKRLSKFNELIAGVREAVPDMIIQVGGSISFAPESEGEAALWLSDDTRHMLAELTPKPDQVTVAVNTTQMNIMELLYPEYLKGTSLEHPAIQEAYAEMTVPAGPAWLTEHLKRLTQNGIQPHFQLTGMHGLETLERMVRKGLYMGPLNLTWIGIGGGFDGPNPFNFFNFIHRVPDGCTLTSESLLKNVLPFNTMSMAMGLQIRLLITVVSVLVQCSKLNKLFVLPMSLVVKWQLGKKRVRFTVLVCSTTVLKKPCWQMVWRRTVKRVKKVFRNVFMK